uniref:Methionine synthase n=2 Tax=uncultured Chloroflexota bacterium TaxID=166587 RepID=H5SL33_9CHLR|nr:methionine synthase [uncultured Chloroflexota bacterium]
MTRKYTNRRYLDALETRVLIYDGAMGTNLQKMNLRAEHFGGARYFGCNDYLVLTYPQAVETVHRSFLEVGVDVIETNTFRSNRITLAEYGLADKVIEINRAAASLARRLADEYAARSGQPRFVAGSIGPSGKLPSADDPELSNITFDELADVFREQAIGLIQGGVDVLLIETSQDILEVKAAIHGILRAFEETGIWLPIQAQVTLDTTGRMLLGTDIQAALTILEGLPIDVIGMNCSTGPEHMREPIRILGEQSRLPVSCIPNAGLPLNVDGQAVYPLEPEPFAAALVEFVEKHHINVVGGCCGTTPAHLKLLVEKLHGRPRPPRPILSLPRLASAIQAVPMRQTPPPMLIGERCNAQGSRKFKQLLLAEDYDGILELAREQVNNGAHALDISTALTERPDEAELMRKVVKKLSMGVEVPLVIDTTEVEVLEVALKTAPGRCLINSTHLESGRTKADRVFRLAKEHNAAVICLTIDEQGMAKTRERKLEVAKRIYELAVHEHGLPPESLVFDALTFTLATGDPEFANSAIETLEGIRLIKQNLPGVLTSLGVSNLSFGLAPHARPVLNSVMLYHAVEAGLDMAIINPAHVTAYADIPAEARELAEDLIFNRRPDALQRYIEYFEKTRPQTSETAADPTSGMTAPQRLYWRIVHRHKEGVEADIDEIIAEALSQDTSDRPLGERRHAAAVHILNNVLLPAMKEVGDKFGAGELILPFVLQSAEVMKRAVAHLETYLEKKEGVSKGRIVLATVYGDVHDIGKNLVKTILVNNGYEVIDLGKQVPAEKIIQTAVETQATAIGLSALLVSTSRQMPLIVNELHRRGLQFPVLIGGAAINRRFGRRILFTESGQPYLPGVFYCKDAFEGLETMDALIDPQQRERLLERILREAEMELGRATATPSTAARPRSAIVPKPLTPLPQKWGPRIVRQMPLEIVFQHLSKNELFRLSWGAKNTHGEEWEHLHAEFEERLARMQKEALRYGWLKPQGVYGYWPCQSEGDDLIIYDPATLQSSSPEEIMRFTFPRQPDQEHLCLADYFASVDSGQFDVVAFQVVTVGPMATEHFEQLQAEGNYTEAYFFHGLAVQTTEATAEYLHRHIRRELGLADGQGKRYSWGYPAIPDLADHRKVFDLLPAESALGMSLTAAYQLVPEQSTAAIIVHHPQAKYYSVGESRVEQLLKNR